jgi:hypothetical protein
MIEEINSTLLDDIDSAVYAKDDEETDEDEDTSDDENDDDDSDDE